MERPRLIEAGPRYPQNVAVVFGLPWFYTEADARRDFSEYGMPKTIRFYEEPTNGVSRGIALVEYDNPYTLTQMQQKLTDVGPYPVKVVLYHMSMAHAWNRTGRLPDLPSDALPFYGRGASGFGPQGFDVRGVEVAVPNTLTEEGRMRLAQLRKRAREDDYVA